MNAETTQKKGVENEGGCLGESQLEAFDVVDTYTRADAIRDGVLVDVSDVAAEAGIRYPTTLTQSVWNEYVKVSDTACWQDLDGRLWDILWMLRFGISKSETGQEEILFKLFVRNDAKPPKEITLKAICHAGDEGEPAITIMRPDED